MRRLFDLDPGLNSAPYVANAVADMALSAGDEDVVVDLAQVFDDGGLLWGDALRYEVRLTTGAADVAAEVSGDSYTHYLTDRLYTHLGDNRGNGPEHALARDNILAHFTSLGLSAQLEGVFDRTTRDFNVVAVQEGVTRPDDIYVLGAHYDSVQNPGADDNASGTAAVMEAARVLSGYDLDATVVYVAFDREEQGLWGSWAYVNDHQDDNMLGMINLDMIAYNPPGENQDKVLLLDADGEGEMKTRLADAFAMYAPGIDAAHILEHEAPRNPHYHSPSDAVETEGLIDFDYATQITRAATGCLALLARDAWLGQAEAVAPRVEGDLLVLDVSALAGTSHVTVRAIDLYGATAEDTFVVTAVAPRRVALQPAGPGADVPAGQAVDLAWTGGGAAHTARAWSVGPAGWRENGGVTDAGTHETQWDTAGLPVGWYRCVLAVQDAGENYAAPLPHATRLVPAAPPAGAGVPMAPLGVAEHVAGPGQALSARDDPSAGAAGSITLVRIPAAADREGGRGEPPPSTPSGLGVPFGLGGGSATAWRWLVDRCGVGLLVEAAPVVR